MKQKKKITGLFYCDGKQRIDANLHRYVYEIPFFSQQEKNKDATSDNDLLQ